MERDNEDKNAEDSSSVWADGREELIAQAMENGVPLYKIARAINHANRVARTLGEYDGPLDIKTRQLKSYLYEHRERYDVAAYEERLKTERRKQRSETLEDKADAASQEKGPNSAENNRKRQDTYKVGSVPEEIIDVPFRVVESGNDGGKDQQTTTEGRNREQGISELLRGLSRFLSEHSRLAKSLTAGLLLIGAYDSVFGYHLFPRAVWGTTKYVATGVFGGGDGKGDRRASFAGDGGTSSGDIALDREEYIKKYSVDLDPILDYFSSRKPERKDSKSYPVNLDPLLDFFSSTK